MRRPVAAVALAALAIGAALPDALAYLKAGPPMAGPGHHRLKSVLPPLDGLPAPSGAYGFRRLRTAYAGSAVKLQRVDLATQDIGFTAGGDFDTAAAAGFCTTACTVQTWYDQSGSGRNLVQAAAANQPPYVASCIGGKPCLQLTSGNSVLQAGSTITPATGIVSFSAVAQKVSGASTCTLIAENAAAGNRIAVTGTANQWGVFGGTSGNVVGTTATDGVAHAASAVLAGAASVFNVDGVETTGTAAGSVAAALPRISGNTATVCNESEAMFWDNDQRTLAERAGLRLNQQSYWGTP